MKKDIQMEVDSHIYERMTDSSGIKSLSEVLDRLGDPAQHLHGWVAEKKLESAAQTFDPILIVKALVLAMIYNTTHIVNT